MSIQSRKPLGYQIGRHEQLEPRNLLAGHAVADAFGAGADFFAAASNIVNHQIAPAATGALQEAHDQFFGQLGYESSSHGDTFTASLTDSNGGTGTATVNYTTGTLGGISAAVLSITGDTTQEGDMETVTIGGAVVGTVTLDSSGSGTLLIQTSTLAAAVAAGTNISLGNLAGSFAAASSTGGGISGGCSSSAGHGELTAPVSDTGGNTATVTYQTGKLLGTQESVVTVTGDTSAAGTSVPVTINGTAVGTVAINSSGSGTLIVPTSSLTTTVAASSTVGVGGLMGTFAASTTTTTSSHAGFTSALSDTGGDTATLTYQTGKLLGVSETVVTVTGDTSAEGTSVPVIVNGATIGLIAIDSTGSGTLIVATSSITTTVASGNPVMVGGLSGTLSPNTSTSGGHGRHHWR